MKVEYEEDRNVPCGRYFHDVALSEDAIIILGGRTRLKSSLDTKFMLFKMHF